MESTTKVQCLVYEEQISFFLFFNALISLFEVDTMLETKEE